MTGLLFYSRTSLLEHCLNQEPKLNAVVIRYILSEGVMGQSKRKIASRELYSVPFSESTSSPSFSLRDSRSNNTQARVKITPCVKGEPFLSTCRVSPFSRGVIFTRARVSLDLPSLRENEGLLMVYLFSSRNKSPFYHAP